MTVNETIEEKTPDEESAENSATDAPVRPQYGLRRTTRIITDGAIRWGIASKHATYSFAALRILYGFIILAVLATCFADRHYLWGVGSQFIDPVADNRGYWWIFEIVFSKNNGVLFDISYVVLAFLALMFMIGWRTRWVGPLLLLYWIGLSVNSTLLTNGGDTVMRITLFFALFADLGGRWSVDAWLRRIGAQKPLPLIRNTPAWFDRIPEWINIRSIPDWFVNLAHNTALILCAYQILLVYANSALFKLQGQEWLSGTATYYSLVLDVFRPFPWLNQLVYAWDFPVNALTYLTLMLQLLFPVLLVWRPSRIVALVGITGTHLGIGLFLGLWPFSLAMIALDFLFVRDKTWDWGIALTRKYWLKARVLWRARRVSRQTKPSEVVTSTQPEGSS